MTTISTIVPWVILACWMTFILVWIVSSFGVKRDVRRGWWIRGWWIRLGIAAVVLVIAWDTAHLSQVTHRIGIFVRPTYGALALLGALLCVCGIALAVWARVHLGRNWSSAPAIKEGHELVTSGPYAFIRHPIYTGVIFAAIGSALTSPVWFFMALVGTATFIWRVHVEERLMTEQFPDQYPAYKARTWTLVPYIW